MQERPAEQPSSYLPLLAAGEPPPPAEKTLAESAAAECPEVGRRPFWKRWVRAWQDCFLGHAGQFVASPLGESVDQNFRIQAANAEAARMVLYHYDFVGCGCALNLRGQDQLAKIAGLLSKNLCPLVIERTQENPGLAEARRLVVLQELARGPYPVPPERVVIGVPPANGLSGIEAGIIYDNLLRQTQSQGTTAGLGGGSIGGTGGQGFNAPGEPRQVVLLLPLPVLEVACDGLVRRDRTPRAACPGERFFKAPVSHGAAGPGRRRKSGISGG